MKLIVFGGGCWGLHHVNGLLKAKQAGRAMFDGLIVVDALEAHSVRETFGDHPDLRYEVSDWALFLDGYIGSDRMHPEDMLVPAPIAPHLFMTWLSTHLSRACPGSSWTSSPLDEAIGTPFESVGPNGERFVSFAEWLCPPNCLEPKRCPAIKAPRTWEMPETVQALEARFGAQGLAVFHSRHYAWGIAALPAQDLLSARDAIRATATEHTHADFLVATVSACHGVVGKLRMRAAEAR